MTISAGVEQWATKRPGVIARPLCCGEWMGLEVVAEGELEDAWIGGGGGVAVAAVAEGGVDGGEVGVVEDMEGFGTEFEVVVFGDVEVLVEGHVEEDETGTLDDAGSGVAVEAGFGSYKSCGVEPLGFGFGAFEGGSGDAVGTECVAHLRDAERG